VNKQSNIKMTYLTRNILKWIVGMLALIFVAFILFYFYIHYLLTDPYNTSWFIIISVLIGILILKKLFDFIGVNYQKWDNGNEAERIVGKMSAKLPKEFKVIKNVILAQRGNIDEVIVGPTGVWVIEVKSHNGKITFDGKKILRNGKPLEKNFLGQAWCEMCEVKNLLKRELRKDLFVQPVICFSGKYAEVHFGLTPVKGIHIVGLNWFNKLIIEGIGHSLDSADIEAIAEILEKYREQ